MIAFDLLTFFGFIEHQLETGVGLGFFIRNFFEERVFVKVRNMPFMEFLNIGDAVQFSSFFENIGVLAEESLVDDSTTVVGSLEVRVGETNEDFLEGVSTKVVGQMSHRVSSQNGDVMALVLLRAKTPDFFSNEIDKFISNFKTHNVFIREKR